MLARQILSKGLLLRNAGILPQAAYHAGSFKQTSMNELPVPEGDWQENHKRNNSKYNLVLITGILALAGTIGFVKATGIIYFNYYPPKSID